MNRLTLSALVAVSLAAPLRAEDHSPKHVRYETLEHSQARAGYPNEISQFAQPAESCRYTGGWIGGSRFATHRRGRGPNEGTWGWDYTSGGWYPGRIFLGWTTGKEPRGGTYKTDGPEVPDVFAISAAKKAERKAEKSAGHE